MKVSLRKANVFVVELQSAIRKVEIGNTVPILEINEFQDPEARVSEANGEFKTEFANILAMVDVLYDIRQKVSVANGTVGISEKLTEVARQEKLMGLYASLKDSDPTPPMEEVRGRLDKIRTQGEDTYRYRADTVQVTALSASEIDDYSDTYKSLKRRVRELKDELLELNVSTTIDLDDKAVNVLKENGIV